MPKPDHNLQLLQKESTLRTLGMRKRPSQIRVRTNDEEVLWLLDTEKHVWDEARFRSSNKTEEKDDAVKHLFAYRGKTLLDLGSEVETEMYVTSKPSACI